MPEAPKNGRLILLLCLLGALLAACTVGGDATTGSGAAPAAETTDNTGDTPAETEANVVAAATQVVATTTRNPAPNAPTAAPTSTQAPQPTTLADILPNLGPAPEINNEVWINSAEPLRLENLRGKVVLIEFWTFG